MTRMALEHIRIVDLTQAWAGAYATQILADYGAEVIKIEARQRPDGWRGGVGASRGYPAYPKEGPGERPHNRAFLANSVNRNKYGITIDLTRNKGRDLLRGLVRNADVVAENFTPRVMKNFGLGFEALHELRPGLIMLSMPAYGSVGPYSLYPGIGGTIEPMAGNSLLLGYEGGPPMNSGVMYPDPVAGIMGALSVLMAVHYRARTGRGQHIDLSQHEAMITMLGYYIVAHSITGETPPKQGNQDPLLAPHRNYRCLGDDQWVAIVARNDADWAHLCRAMGRPELSGDPRFASMAARRENHTVVDLIVEEWTQRRSAEEIEASLQAVGVPVGKVRNMREIHACPQLNARRFFASPVHREVGSRRTAGIPARLSRSPGAVRWAAPCLGQDSAEVFRRHLGLSDNEIAKLTEEGITGEEPL